MYTMVKPQSARKRRFALITFCHTLGLALSLSQGCARQEAVYRPDGASPAGQQKLPFHPDPHLASDNDGARPAVPSDPRLPTAIPFQAGSKPRILSFGTLLTVQLDRSLSTAKVRAGDSFSASVAAPLTIEGETLVERGTPVIGLIESAQSETGRAQALGYFRLTLSAITIGGRQVGLQTSSLFTRGTIQPSNVSSRSGSVRVLKGRRLTFRLTAPVTLDDPNPGVNRQSASAIAE